MRAGVISFLVAAAGACSAQPPATTKTEPKKDRSTTTSYVAGETWIFPGKGPASVIETRTVNGKSMVMMQLPFGTRAGVPIEKAATLLRRPVSGPEADGMVALLSRTDGATDERPWAVRMHEAMVAMAFRPPSRQVKALHADLRREVRTVDGESGACCS